LQVRVTIDPDLQFRVTATALPKTTARSLPLRLDVVPTQVTALAIHKSTARDTYDAARARIGADYSRTGAPNHPFDVLMWNSYGEVTETSIANFAVYLSGSELLAAVPGRKWSLQEQEKGVFVTPSLRSGLIAGVMRAELLEKGEIAEGTIMRENILRYAKVCVAIKPVIIEANLLAGSRFISYGLLQCCSWIV
jgi:branched-subunit amino acid aminotransferase/4-amino-4-deoxychorismate lyase